MAIFSKSKMAPATILFLQKMINLVTLSTSSCHSAPACQILWESAHPRRRNGTFMKSIIGGRCHLEFWIDDISSHTIQFKCYFVSTYKIGAKSINPGQSYGYFSKIQDGGRRHLEFLLDGIFGQVFRFTVVFCTCAQNLNQIPRSWARLLLFFAKSKMAAVRHFGIVMTSFMTIRVDYLVMSWVC